jgi:DNA-binding transcriptional LysR family regulator
VDLDLAQVRAFVATAEELHFGRAAGHLFLSQQALSKRIARLEVELGVLLFVRGKHAVELTEAGQRFLAPARRLLAAGDRAVGAARHTTRPVRLDVWGHLYGPMRTVGQVVEDTPEISTEVGLSRDLPATVTALLHGEIDAGFGRVYPLAPHDEDRLTSRLARLEPVDAVFGADHRLAGRPEVCPADLRDSVLWCPAALSRLDFLRHFAERFSIRTEEGGANLGLDQLIERLRADPRRFSLLPADVWLPDDAGVRLVPLIRPTPVYAWSLIWRPQDQHPSLGALLRRFAEIGHRLRWLDFEPGTDWLPDHDHAELQRLQGATTGRPR